MTRLLKFVVPLTLICVFQAFSQDAKLFLESCGLPLNKNGTVKNSTVPPAHCDASKNLDCANGRCICFVNYVYDGSCGCKWGLVGFGGKCNRYSETARNTCDFMKNLVCDPNLRRCRCKPNHGYDGSGGCKPGSATYGSPCHEPLHNRSKPTVTPKSNVTSTVPVTTENGLSTVAPTVPSKSGGASRRKRSNVTNTHAENMAKLAEKLKVRKPPAMRISDLNATTKSSHFPTTTPVFDAGQYDKCNATRYAAISPEERESDAEDNEAFTKEESGNRCNPDLHLQCLQEKCTCVNEKTYQMFRPMKDNQRCKLSNLYACAENADCISENCATQKDNFTRVCLEKGMKSYTQEANSGNEKRISMSVILIPILTKSAITFVNYRVN